MPRPNEKDKMFTDRFSIHDGQIRTIEFFGHNAGWFNKDGRQVGYGDLNNHDIQNIMANLEEGEKFITVGESDLYVVHGEQPIIDKEYVANHCRYIVTKGETYYVDRYGFGKGDEYSYHDGVKVRVVNPAQGCLLVLV